VRFISAINKPFRNGLPKIAFSALDLQRKETTCCYTFDDNLKMRIDSNIAHPLVLEIANEGR